MAFPLLNSIRLSFFTGPGLAPSRVRRARQLPGVVPARARPRRVPQRARQHRRVLPRAHAGAEHARPAVRRAAVATVPRPHRLPGGRVPPGDAVGDRLRVPVDVAAQPPMGQRQQDPRRRRPRRLGPTVARRHDVRPAGDRPGVELAEHRAGDDHLHGRHAQPSPTTCSRRRRSTARRGGGRSGRSSCRCSSR